MLRRSVAGVATQRRGLAAAARTAITGRAAGQLMRESHARLRARPRRLSSGQAPAEAAGEAPQAQAQPQQPPPPFKPPLESVSEVRQADQLMREGRFADAQPLYATALQIVTGDADLAAEVKLRLARLERARGNWVKELVLLGELVMGSGRVLAPEGTRASVESSLVVAMMRAEHFDKVDKLAPKLGQRLRARGDNLSSVAVTMLWGYSNYMRGFPAAVDFLAGAAGYAKVGELATNAVNVDVFRAQALVAEHSSKDYDAARAKLLSAMDFCQQHLPTQPRELASVYCQIGELETRHTHFDAAEDYLGSALKIHETEFGHSAPETAPVLRLLGNLFMARGEPVEAEGLLRSAMNRLEDAIEHKGGYQSVFTKQQLVDVLQDYVRFLERAEFNGRSRAPETRPLLDRMVALHRETPAVKARNFDMPIMQDWVAERYCL